jgi:hypothetical protein
MAPSPVYPLFGPTISGTTITVDTYLNPPTVIPEYVRAFAGDNRGYFIEELFSTPGWTVQGGALIFTPTFPEDMFLDPNQSLAPRAPGAESPLIGAKRFAPQIVRPESISGKIEIPDETRRRNDVAGVQSLFRKTANTFAERMQTRGIAALNSAITAWGRTTASISWSDAAAAAGGVINVARSTQPAATFGQVLEQFENDMTGVVPDTLIVNPAEALNLRLIYEDKLDAFLRTYGISNMHSTVKQLAGTAVFAKSKQVGAIAFEKPLEQEQGRGPTGTWKDVYALEMQPVFAALDASAVLAVTGLAA